MTGLFHAVTSCTWELFSQNTEQTQRVAQRLGELVRGGELLLLDGQLGAGKTTFTQGLARGMNISATVSSPTFTLLKEYQVEPRPASLAVAQQAVGFPASPSSQKVLYHFDLYRLDDPDELYDLGFEEYIGSSGVCVVEWADKVVGFWPDERLRIRLTFVDETRRHLLFEATGTHYCELLKQLQC